MVGFVNNARSTPTIYTPPRTSVSTSQDIETHLGPTPPRATLLPSPEPLEWWQFQEAWCRVNENVRSKQLSGYTNNVVKFKGMFTLYVIIIWEDSNALQKSV